MTAMTLSHPVLPVTTDDVRRALEFLSEYAEGLSSRHANDFFRAGFIADSETAVRTAAAHAVVGDLRRYLHHHSGSPSLAHSSCGGADDGTDPPPCQPVPSDSLAVRCVHQFDAVDRAALCWVRSVFTAASSHHTSGAEAASSTPPPEHVATGPSLTRFAASFERCAAAWRSSSEKDEEVAPPLQDVPALPRARHGVKLKKLTEVDSLARFIMEAVGSHAQTVGEGGDTPASVGNLVVADIGAGQGDLCVELAHRYGVKAVGIERDEGQVHGTMRKAVTGWQTTSDVGGKGADPGLRGMVRCARLDIDDATEPEHLQAAVDRELSGDSSAVPAAAADGGGQHALPTAILVTSFPIRAICSLHACGALSCHMLRLFVRWHQRRVRVGPEQEEREERPAPPAAMVGIGCCYNLMCGGWLRRGCRISHAAVPTNGLGAKHERRDDLTSPMPHPDDELLGSPDDDLVPQTLFPLSDAGKRCVGRLRLSRPMVMAACQAPWQWSTAPPGTNRIDIQSPFRQPFYRAAAEVRRCSHPPTSTRKDGSGAAASSGSLPRLVLPRRHVASCEGDAVNDEIRAAGTFALRVAATVVSHSDAVREGDVAVPPPSGGGGDDGKSFESLMRVAAEVAAARGRRPSPSDDPSPLPVVVHRSIVEAYVDFVSEWVLRALVGCVVELALLQDRALFVKEGLRAAYPSGEARRDVNVGLAAVLPSSITPRNLAVVAIVRDSSLKK